MSSPSRSSRPSEATGLCRGHARRRLWQRRMPAIVGKTKTRDMWSDHGFVTDRGIRYEVPAIGCRAGLGLQRGSRPYRTSRSGEAHIHREGTQLLLDAFAPSATTCSMAPTNCAPALFVDLRERSTWPEAALSLIRSARAGLAGNGAPARVRRAQGAGGHAGDLLGPPFFFHLAFLAGALPRSAARRPPSSASGPRRLPWRDAPRHRDRQPRLGRALVGSPAAKGPCGRIRPADGREAALTETKPPQHHRRERAH